MKLRLFLLEKSRLQWIIGVIRNENFLSNAFKYDLNLVRSTIFDINWISKLADMNKSDWRSLNAIPALLNLLKRAAERYKLYIYMACANIADDKEIEEITEIQSSIETFVSFVNQTANDLKHGCVERMPLQFKDDEDDHKNEAITSYDVCYCMDFDNNASVSITGNLLAIYRLSINPATKWTIWSIVNFKESLKTFLRDGNDIEKLYSIQVMAQLAFDKKVLDQMLEDKELVNLISSLAQDNQNASYAHLTQTTKARKIAKQMAWSFDEIEKDKLKSSTKPMLNEEKDDNKNKHIMISYNTGSRELCLRIKEELEKNNHKVWIDVNEV